jgi:hypothetical protein
MKQVSVMFKLSGRSVKTSNYDEAENFTLADVYESVKGQVEFNFGKRPMLFANNSTSGLGFYSAGWFLSQDAEPTELVVVAYGGSMANATKNMFSYVSNVEWDKVAKSV